MNQQPCCTRQQSPRNSSESGVNLILLMVILVFLVGLLAMVIGLGILMTDKAKLQNSTNLAALAAQEAILSDPSETYSARADAALAKANEILAANKIYGVSGSLGGLVHYGQDTTSSGGYMETGMYYPFAPTGSSPCKTYPCYVKNSGPPASMPGDTKVNAIRIYAKNQPSNPIMVPFAKIFGMTQGNINSPSTATMIERCTALVLDVSPSMSLTTHPFSDDINLSPTNMASLAFRESTIKWLEQQEAVSGTTCTPTDFPGSLNAKYWCSMPTDPGAIPGQLHYRSHYKTVESKNMRARFDLFTDPEPLKTFLTAFNSSLQKLIELQTVSDKFVLIAYNRGIIDRIPAAGLTTDLPYLEQITNLNNIGKVDQNGNWVVTPLHPNFIDRGWFSPVGPNGYTNTIYALQTAIAALADTTQCSSSARKSIILASDGILNCDYARPNGPTNCNIIFEDPSNKGVALPNTYWLAEQHLVGTTGTNGAVNNPILYDLIQNKIRITTMVSGAHVQPNFLNTIVNGKYMDYDQAMGLGYHGLPHNFGLGLQLVLEDSYLGANGIIENGYSGDECTTYANLNKDACAWKYAGAADGVQFRRASSVMAELSILSGGIYCPLMPIWNSAGCYDSHKLKDCCRTGAGGGSVGPACSAPSSPCRTKKKCTNNGITYSCTNVTECYQSYSLSDYGSGVDAAGCVNDTLGQSPYMLLPLLGIEKAEAGVK